MAYGSKRVFVYESDITGLPWGMRLSELVYEKNPQLGTTATISPSAGLVFQALPGTVHPRYAVFRNTASKATRKFTVLSLQSDIWTGVSKTIAVPAQDPDDPNWDIEVIEFTAVSFVGETNSGMLVTGVDTGMTQGDQD